MRQIIVKLSVLLLASLTAVSAHATMTLQALSGGSNITYPTDPTTGAALKPIIYVGRAGPACTSGDTCDSCALTTGGLVPCNKNSINPGSNFHIELKTDTSTTYNSSEITAYINSTSFTVTGTYDASNKYLTLNIPWSVLCQKLGADSSCIGAPSGGIQTLSVGLGTGSGVPAEKYDVQIMVSGIAPGDNALQYTATCTPDGTLSDSSSQYGYCYFEATRGDSKVYIDPLIPTTTYPQYTNGITYNGIVAFYESGAEGNETSIINSISSKSSSKSFDWVSTGLSDNRVDGLENDQRYCFVIGNKDITGNIFFYSPPPGSSPPGGVPQTAAQMCATPAIVSGLLDDKHCFIATATFGSDMAPQTQAFRNFRNHYMLNGPIGESLVKAYYKISPPMAQFISEHETLRAGARVALWPLLMFAKLSLQWGIIWASLLYAVIVFAMVEGIRRLPLRRSRKIA